MHRRAIVLCETQYPYQPVWNSAGFTLDRAKQQRLRHRVAIGIAIAISSRSTFGSSTQ